MECKCLINAHVGQHYYLHEILPGVLRQAMSLQIHIQLFIYAAHATLL